jgi:hypothetical protein
MGGPVAFPVMNYINGMCIYLASQHPKNYDHVGQVYSLQILKQIEARKTLAIVLEASIGETQFETPRA